MQEPKGLTYRFRGIRALYGEEAFLRFRNSHVVVIGTGGVGSWAIEALVRSGIGKITIIDNDTIDESNTNRQLHTLHGQYGREKATVMRERMLLINPQVQVEAITQFLTAENMSTLLPEKFDFLIDAIDSLDAKSALIAYAVQQKLAFVTSGGAGGKVDPQKITINDLSMVTNDKLLARVRAKLRKEYNFPKSPQKMHVMAVYSAEQGKLAKEVTETDDVPSFGAGMCVTATVGLNLASIALQYLGTHPKKEA